MINLAVALDAAADPGQRYTLDYWTGLAREAEHGGVDFVTIEDPSGFPGGYPGGRPQHRLDAVVVASALAGATERLGLVPTVSLNYGQPLAIAKAIATLDHLSAGRAGWRSQQSPFRPIPIADLDRPDVQASMAERFDRAADLVRVVRAVWRGVTDEAELRALAPAWFDAGEWYTVLDPATAPPAPQGQPVIFTLAHITIPFRYGARSADIVSVTPRDRADVVKTVAEVHDLAAQAGREPETVKVFADLVVFLDRSPASGFDSDAYVVAGPATRVADLIAEWHEAGIAGFRLRPGAATADLLEITRSLVPELRGRGLLPESYPPAGTLRERLGLPPV